MHPSTVLIADSDPVLRAQLRQRLGRGGSVIEEAGTAAEALLRVNAAIDVVVLDAGLLAGTEISTNVKVTDSAGLITAGQFLRADAVQVRVLTANAETTLDKARVLRVILEERQGWRKAKRGFTIGAVAGGVFGLFATGNVPWAAMLASGWGSLGCLFGAIDGASDVHQRVIYDIATTQAGTR